MPLLRVPKEGSKYVITVDKVFKDEHGNKLYRIRGFNSLVFDSRGITKLSPYETPLLTSAVKKAYDEGVFDTETKYEMIVDRYEKSYKKLTEKYMERVEGLRQCMAAKDDHIKKLYATIENLRGKLNDEADQVQETKD